MSTIIRSSDLDFDAIKTNLKTFFKKQTEFKDYDFEASAMSNILDVLAYNTHVNGLIANFALNESFLPSAQLRSSIVSHAETLGYYPKSKTASTAVVTLTAATSDTSTPSASLPINSTFSVNIDDVTYTFQTLEAFTAVNDGSGNFVFKTSAGSSNITITEGTLKTKTFVVGDTTDQQIYVIPDETMDTTTIRVKVYDTITSSSFDTYTDINDSVRINTNSTVYIVREAPNGYYEITFGEGNVLGKSPSAGNKIEITYLSNSGADANGGGKSTNPFSADAQVTIGGTPRTLTVSTVTTSSGGSEKESIESIKANAPLAFATQQRLVTAEDYRALISERYSTVVKDVIAWGGNDNIPADYGKVYVSINFKDGITADAQTTTKNNIKTTLSDNLAIMSIDTEFADPIDSFLELTTSFDFDPDLSGTTVETMQNTIQSDITSFFSSNLNTFEAVFRRSALLARIDELDTGILNSSITAKIQQRLTPTNNELNSITDYVVQFPVALAQPDDVNHIVTSSPITFNGNICTIKNRLESNVLQVVKGDGTVLQDNIGSYNTGNGKVNIAGLNISAFEGDAIKFSAVPANQSTIKPLRNYILKFDPVLSNATGNIDYQNTAVTLT